MCQGQRIVAADLQEQVALASIRVESINRELLQGLQPVRDVLLSGQRHQLSPESEGHRQPGRIDGELGFGVGQRRLPLSQRSRIRGEQPQPAHRLGGLDPGFERERDEVRVRLRRGLDPGLMSAEERLGLRPVRPVQISPGQPAVTGARALRPGATAEREPRRGTDESRTAGGGRRGQETSAAESGATGLSGHHGLRGRSPRGLRCRRRHRVHHVRCGRRRSLRLHRVHSLPALRSIPSPRP